MENNIVSIPRGGHYDSCGYYPQEEDFENEKLTEHYDCWNTDVVITTDGNVCYKSIDKYYVWKELHSDEGIALVRFDNRIIKAVRIDFVGEILGVGLPMNNDSWSETPTVEIIAAEGFETLTKQKGYKVKVEKIIFGRGDGYLHKSKYHEKEQEIE
jgi:hypothetical protein